MIQKTNAAYFIPTPVDRKTLRVRTHLTETRYVLRESHGRCRDYNPTRPRLCAVSLEMKLWQLWFAASAVAKTAAEAGRTLCLLCSPTWRSRTELSLVISVAICTTRRHWFLQNRSFCGKDAGSGGSEQPWEVKRRSILLKDKVVRILFQLGQKL
jgi:hypothetical protein